MRSSTLIGMQKELRVDNEDSLVLEKRFQVFVERDHALRDIVGYLSKDYSVGDKIPSERDLELVTGYSRARVREALIRLECFGYIDINHGKANHLLKSFTQE